MSHTLHSTARTTPKIREEIKASGLSERKLAEKYNVTRSTVRKWKGREGAGDLPHTAHTYHTTLSELEEAVVVSLRETLFLPLDDLLCVTQTYVNPKVSRSGLNRCLVKHGLSRLKDILPKDEKDADETPKKTFKDYLCPLGYDPGFLHIDIKYLPKMPDESQRRYLFVAIDRATRWVFLHVYDDMTEASSVDFLQRVHTAAPMKITKLLTDNGTQFTDRFTAKGKQPSGGHAFDQACAQLGIEHRLCPPRHPQTNGMVERFNGRISELLGQTRFGSADELEQRLLAYLLIYNGHIPQRALGHQTPLQAVEKWRVDKPDLFTETVSYQAGLDI